MSTSNFPPIPNIMIPALRESLDEYPGQLTTLEEQLAIMAEEHPVDDLAGLPPLVEMPYTLIFYETPEDKFEAVFPIYNTSRTLVTYTVYASNKVFTTTPTCGIIKPRETAIVSFATQRDSHDAALTLFKDTRYCVQIMEYPTHGSPMLSAIRSYWGKALGKPNIQVTWISNFAFLKTPAGFERTIDAMDAFLPGGSGDGVGDGDPEELTPMEELPNWLDMEHNWEYLGVGLRPYTAAILEGVEKMDELVLDQVEDPSYFTGIPNFIVHTLVLPWVGLVVLGGSLFAGRLVMTLLNGTAGGTAST